jgi:hypothetical protein
MDLPCTALRTFPKLIEAACYNRARLTLHRLGRPLRVAIGGHHGLEVILEDRCWLCVDSFHDDVPVLAWCRFDTKGRRDLQAPVRCSLKLLRWRRVVALRDLFEALATGAAELRAGLDHKSGQNQA